MNKSLFLLLVVFLYSVTLRAQKLNVVVNYVANDPKASDNSIIYQPGKLLSWSDFKGAPVAGSDAAALTNAGFSVKLMFRRDEDNAQLVISVNCSFSKKDSWVQPGSKTEYILNHEQKHYDLAYIYTLLFIRELRAAKFTEKNYGALIQQIHSKTGEALNDVQDQYDLETSHSRIPAKQAEWDRKISEQLEAVLKSEAKE